MQYWGIVQLQMKILSLITLMTINYSYEILLLNQ